MCHLHTFAGIIEWILIPLGIALQFQAFMLFNRILTPPKETLGGTDNINAETTQDISLVGPDTKLISINPKLVVAGNDIPVKREDAIPTRFDIKSIQHPFHLFVICATVSTQILLVIIIAPPIKYFFDFEKENIQKPNHMYSTGNFIVFCIFISGLIIINWLLWSCCFWQYWHDRYLSIQKPNDADISYQQSSFFHNYPTSLAFNQHVPNSHTISHFCVERYTPIPSKYPYFNTDSKNRTHS